MKVLVISDTHGDISSLNEIISRHKDIDYFIHSGDTYADALLISQMYDIPFKGVRGNSDTEFNGQDDYFIFLEDVGIFVTHGHRYNVKSSINNIYYKGLEMKANIVIFGHTHLPYNYDIDGLLIINPGSVSRPRSGNRGSYGVLVINNGDYRYKHYNI